MSKKSNKGKPVFGTKEWAEDTCDVIRGCKHGCRYCYAKAEGVRFKTNSPLGWTTESLIPIGEKSKLAKLLKKKTPMRIMFPAHHDMASMDTFSFCWEAIGGLLRAGHSLLIVSKPHMNVIRVLLNSLMEIPDAKDRVIFRFTIGSADDNTLKFWEPNAPAFGERLACLKMAFDYGWKTSVSCEPMLDNNVEAVVEACRPFVNDAIWIGLPNFLDNRLAINGEGESVREAGRKLVATLSNARVMELYGKFKDDPVIRWKESIKKIVGVEVPTTAGLDV